MNVVVRQCQCVNVEYSCIQRTARGMKQLSTASHTKAVYRVPRLVHRQKFGRRCEPEPWWRHNLRKTMTCNYLVLNTSKRRFNYQMRIATMFLTYSTATIQRYNIRPSLNIKSEAISRVMLNERHESILKNKHAYVILPQWQLPSCFTRSIFKSSSLNLVHKVRVFQRDAYMPICEQQILTCWTQQRFPAKLC